MKSPTLLSALYVLLSVSACSNKQSGTLPGYIEGEFVYVSAPVSGKLQALQIARGAQVQSGTPLFELEAVDLRAQRDAANARLLQARATVSDVRKGQRPTELDALQAQYKQAQSALVLAEKEFLRQQNIFATVAGTSQQDVDRARMQRDQAREQVANIEAQLKTARLGARADQVSAAQANADALEAQLAQADWQLDQSRQTAAVAGLVSDTLYREGEWIAAGKPVVVILPPGNVKARVFVPQAQLSNLRLGGSAKVSIDGRATPIDGKISFISPTLEFTPPVIYSRDMRQKFVSLVEIAFAPADAATLHPGQPLDASFDSQPPQ